MATAIALKVTGFGLSKFGRQLAKLAKRMAEKPLHSVVVCRDFLVYPLRHFRIGWRRMVKKGQKTGILLLAFGWVAFSIRW